MTFALILALIRKVPAAFDSVKRGEWDRDSYQGSELHGKTLGIVGMGRVGSQIRDIAESFGMKVTYCDIEEKTYPVAEFDNGRWVDCGMSKYENYKGLDDLLQNSDIITVHVSLNSETKGMFGREQFAMMKPTAYFINTSRGQVVDETALITALLEKRIAGAAIDVAYNEPAIWDCLRQYTRKYDNLLITPHLGGQTAESRNKTQLHLADKILNYYKRGE
jgi:D-3-phosphoglycerate dehydrogenase